MPVRSLKIKAVNATPIAPERTTLPWPMFYSIFGGIRRTDKRPIPKPSPYNLRRFAEIPVCRAAINKIKDPICGFAWKVAPLDGLDLTPDMEARIQTATNCLRSPNNVDSFRSFLEQLVDDTLTVAGAAEIKVTPDQPEHPGWLFIVDAASIRIMPNWSGDPDEARYAQMDLYDQYGGETKWLRNDQLTYIRMNPRSCTPFGLTPTEVAYTLVNSFSTAFAYAEKLAGNMTPPGILDLGPDATPEDVAMMSAIWENAVEGQGRMPITGGYGQQAPDGKSETMRYLALSKGDDAELRISWQMWIVRLIALAYGLAPQSLNLETTVNRATAEVMSEDEELKAIRPCARLVAEHLTRDFLWGALGYGDLQFQFEGLEPEDDESQARIWGLLDDHDLIVPDEIRKELGRPEHPNGWGKLTSTQRKVLIMQARGSATETEDPGEQTVDASRPPAKARKGPTDDESDLQAVAQIFARAIEASKTREPGPDIARFNEAIGHLATLLGELEAS